MELTITQPAEQKHKLGNKLITAAACSYPPAVMPDDVLLVDMDVDRVTVDGIYLMQRIEAGAGAVTWLGCRRFEVAITGGLRVDETGHGDWVPFTGAAGLRIAGRVLRVYRPTDAR